MEQYEDAKGKTARRVSRRNVLKLMGAGVGSAAVLAACGDPTATIAPAATTAAPAGATTAAAGAATTAAAGAATTAAVAKASGKVVVATGRDPSGTVKKLLDDYNKLNTGVTVEYQELEQDSTAQKNKYTTLFAAKDSSVDVIAMDIPWGPEFGSAGWITPLDKYVTPEIKSQFFEGTIAGATFKDKLYGLPWYINVGLLYYRTDLLEAAGIKPPNTYEDLIDAATKLQKPDTGLYGFIHHGFQNEGLPAAWMEILWGYGGEFWDPKTSEVVVNKDGVGEKALQWWLDNIYTRKISPDKIPGWKAADIRAVFNQGNAVFMRDFFDGYQPSQGAESKVVGKVGVKPMVAAQGQKGSGCLGNWYMGISSFSKNQDAAWAVLQYMTGKEGSAARALGSGLPPGNKTAYTDKALLDKYPSFALLSDVLATAKPRPVTPAYNQLSGDVLQVQIANVLTKKSTPKEAATAMAEKGGPLLAKFK